MFIILNKSITITKKRTIKIFVNFSMLKHTLASHHYLIYDTTNKITLLK